jgi:glycosyltransferase involved in cell wall biosynthesis
MRIALVGDFDTYVIRGLERPQQLLPYHLSPGLNLLRGLREIGVSDIHIIGTTGEVNTPTVEEGPFGTVHRLPSPLFSGSASFYTWRRHLILKELRGIKPDVVHAQGTEQEYALTAVTSPYPNVITIHGIMHRVHRVTRPPLLSLSHVPRWMEKIVAHRAGDVICLSREVEDFFKERGSRARCHLIPNAVAPCFFDVQPQPRAEAGFALLFVGTIYPLKGLLHLVEALAEAQQKLGAGILLRVIGQIGGGVNGAEYHKQLRRRAEELHIAGRIQWLGVLNERDVARQLAHSDVLVLPSFQETLPMAVAEAMAAGVPVIATRAGGTPELVEHNQTGLLVTPGRSDELAAALCELLPNATLRRQFGAAGRAKALAAYAPRVVAEKTLEVYETIYQRGRAGSPRH